MCQQVRNEYFKRQSMPSRKPTSISGRLSLITGNVLDLMAGVPGLTGFVNKDQTEKQTT